MCGLKPALFEIGEVKEGEEKCSGSDVELAQLSLRVIEIVRRSLDKYLVELNFVGRVAQEEVQEVDCPDIDLVYVCVLLGILNLLRNLLIVDVLGNTCYHLSDAEALDVLLIQLGGHPAKVPNVYTPTVQYSLKLATT